MKKLSRSFCAGLMISVLMLQSLQPVAAIAERQIRNKVNQTGPYYQMDLTQNEAKTKPLSDTTFQTNSVNEATRNPQSPAAVLPFNQVSGLISAEYQDRPAAIPAADPNDSLKPQPSDIPSVSPDDSEPEETPVSSELPEPKPEPTPATEGTSEAGSLPEETSIPAPDNTASGETPEPDASPDAGNSAQPRFKEMTESLGIEPEPGFSSAEYLNETTTCYQSETEPDLKQIIFSDQVVNYASEDGFLPIDLRLQSAPDLLGQSDEPSGWQNLTNTLQSFYPFDLNDSGITLTAAETQVTLTPSLQPEGEPTVQENQIIYPMEDQIQLHYQIFGGRVREDIILNQPQSRHQFTYTLKTNGAFRTDSQGLTVLDEKGKPAFLIRAPKAYDAAGQETAVTLQLEGGQLTFSVDESWLEQEDRVYPVTVDPDYIGMAHEGIDISVGYNDPYHTISNPDMEASNWVLQDRNDGFLYTGKDPLFGDSYAFYKFQDYRIAEVLQGKYIKEAKLGLSVETISQANTLNACTINGTFDIQGATYTNFPNDYTCTSALDIKPADKAVVLDVTDYLKGVVEDHHANNGVLLALKDQNGYARFLAHEHYYFDYDGTGTPWTSAIYYDSPDVSMTDVNAVTFKLRPFVRYRFEEGLTYFVAMGFDGTAPRGSSVELKVSRDGADVFTQTIAAADNFFHYPDYPAIENAQQYKTLESNWQSGEFMQNFESGKLYTVSVQAKKGTAVGTVKTGEFQVYEVKAFDLLEPVAEFYGVSTAQLLNDNNMQDTLITEGNRLVIMNPQKNKGLDYVTEELSTDEKKQIDASLRGRGLQCEYGFEPINLNTGSFLMEAEDFSFNLFGEPFSFTRTYNSTGAVNPGIFGYGWNFTHHYAVSKGAGGATVLMEDGVKYYFQQQSDGSYTNDLTDAWTLVWDTDHFVLSSLEKTLRFNKWGQLEQSTDRKGAVTRLVYDQMKLIRMELPDGRQLSFHYAGNQVSDIQLSDGSQVCYGYDADGNLTSFADQTGALIQYEYDDQHNLVRWINQIGKVTVTNTYDDQHRVIRQIDGDGHQADLQYFETYTETRDARGQVQRIDHDGQGQTSAIHYPDGSKEEKVFVRGRLMSETLENGVSTQYTYDSRGNLTQSLRSDGFQVDFEIDGENNVTAMRNSAGQNISYTYDERGNQLTMTDSLGQVTQSAYNANNQRISVTDAYGAVTAYDYDAYGNQTAVQYPDGSGYTYTYNDAGFLTSISDHHGQSTTYVLNDRNEQIEIHQPDGGRILNGLDASGNLISVTNSLGGVTRYEVDLAGNVIQETDPLGAVRVYRYDQNRNLIESREPDGVVTVFERDERGRVIRETVNGRTTAYTYNRYGIASEINSRGQTKTYNYDSLGRVIEIQDVDGLSVHYEYDVLGNKTAETDKKGRTTRYFYDLNQNLIRTETETAVTTLTLDARGQTTAVQRVTQDSTQTSFSEYNATGKLIRSVDTLGRETIYTYDGNQLMTLTDAAGQTTSYAYDAMNRLILERSQDGSERRYTYDTAGNVTAKTDGNGKTTRMTYNPRGDLIEEINALGHATQMETDAQGRTLCITTPMGLSTRFTYDPDGNILTESLSGQLIRAYEYNREGDLIRQTVRGVTTVYDNDEFGQRIRSETDGGLITETIWDEFHRISEERINGQTDRKLVYNDEDQVVMQTDRYGAVTEWEINDDQQVISKTEDGLTTWMEYDAAGQLIKETDSLGNVRLVTYDAIGNCIGQSVNGKVTTMDYDALGQLIRTTDSLGRVTEWVNDSEGHVLKMIDANGTITESDYDELYNLCGKRIDGEQISQWFYDADGRQIKSVDGEGGVRQTVYDEFNQVVMTVNELGYPTQFAYDERGNQIRITDAAGNSVLYQYNANNQCVSQTDQEGHKTQFEHDVFGNVSRQINADGSVMTNEVNALNQLVKTVNADGGELTYTYNHRNQLVETFLDGQRLSTSVWDDLGRKTARIDARGNQTSYAYDSENHLISETDALGNTQTWDYDSEGQMIRSTDLRGIVTEKRYDGIGQEIASTVNGERTVLQQYDSRGNRILLIDGEGQPSAFVYDLKNQLVGTRDALGNETRLTYDEAGHLIAETDALGNTTEMIYDEMDNLIQTVDGEGHRTTQFFDRAGNLTGVQDGRGYHLNYELDAMGNVIRKVHGEVEVRMTYDPAGRLTSITDETGKTESYAYDHRGNQISMTQKNGHEIQFIYDENQNLITRGQTEFVYDALNRMTEMRDSEGVTRFEYDEAGNLTQTERNGAVILYTLNAYGEREALQYPDGTVQKYRYDHQGRLIETDNGTLVTQVRYDAAGNVIEEHQSSGLHTEKTWDAYGNLTSMKTFTDDELISEEHYTYNRNHSLIREEKTQLGKHSVQEHEYDESDQLVKTVTTSPEGEVSVTKTVISLTGNKVEITDGQGTKSLTYNDANQITELTDSGTHYRYDYDDNGNRIREVRDDGAVKTYIYDEQNQLIEVTDFDQTQIRYTYDGLGNRESQTVKRGRMETLTQTVSESIESFIERVKLAEQAPSLFEHPETREAQSAHWEYLKAHYCHPFPDREWGGVPSGSAPAVETETESRRETRSWSESWEESRTDITEIQYINDLSLDYTQVLSQIQDGVKRNYYYGNQRLGTDEVLYTYDGLDNVTVLFSSDVKLIESYTYSDYGQRDQTVDPFLNLQEMGYRSEMHTVDGMQYLRARYYDTRSESFVQQDSALGSLNDPLSQNRYDYGRNNPVKYTDPSGHWNLWNAAKNAVKKVVNTVKKAATAVVNTVKKAVSNVVNTVKRVVNNVVNPPKTVYNPGKSSVSAAVNSSRLGIRVATGGGFSYSGGGSSGNSYKNVAPVVQPLTAKQIEQISSSHKTVITSTLNKALSKKTTSQVEKRTLEKVKLTELASKLSVNVPNIKGSLAERYTGWCEAKKLKDSDEKQDRILKALDKMAEGRILHLVIEREIRENVYVNGGIITEKSIGNIVKQPGSSSLRPDLVVYEKQNDTYYVYEIKPDTIYGHTTGPKQVTKYVDKIEELLPENTNVHVYSGGNAEVDTYLKEHPTIWVEGKGEYSLYQNNGVIYYRQVSKNTPETVPVPVPNTVPEKDSNKNKVPESYVPEPEPLGQLNGTTGLIVILIVAIFDAAMHLIPAQLR